MRLAAGHEKGADASGAGVPAEEFGPESSGGRTQEVERIAEPGDGVGDLGRGDDFGAAMRGGGELGEGAVVVPCGDEAGEEEGECDDEEG